MTRRGPARVLVLALVTASLGLAPPGAAQGEPETPPGQVPLDDVWCAVCHFEQGDQFAQSVHYRKGLLLCNDCHGGDPTQAQPQLAKGPATGFIGRPQREAIAGICGKCHTGPAEAFARGPHHDAGNRDNPTCVTCHQNHGVVDATPALMDTACAACHRGPSPALERGRAVQTALRAAATRLRAVSARFDSLRAGRPALERCRPLLDAAASALRGADARTHALDLADLGAVVTGFDQELGAVGQALDEHEESDARRRWAVVGVWLFVGANVALLWAKRRRL